MKTSPRWGLLLRFSWGEHRLHSTLLRPEQRRSFCVGSAAGVDFACDDVAGTARFELVSASEPLTVRFARGMTGTLWRSEDDCSLAEAIERNQASPDDGGFAVTLSPRDALRLELSGICVEALPVRVPEVVAAELLESLDLRMLNVLAAVFTCAMLFVVTAAVAEASEEPFADDMLPRAKSLAHYVAPPKPLAAAPQMAVAPSREGKAPPSKVLAVKQPEGKVKGPKSVAALLQGAFGSLFASGDDGSLAEALGSLKKGKSLSALGIEGLGLKGDASGGGGGTTIGLGGIVSRSRGGGRDPYGLGSGFPCGAAGCKEKPMPETTVTDVTVVGMDKELIRQVIHRHRSEVRYCYELALTQHPDAQGKTSVKFVIGASGAVEVAKVVDSTMHLSELDACVAGRVRTWEFPKPPGGGSAIVTYPFVFARPR